MRDDFVGLCDSIDRLRQAVSHDGMELIRRAAIPIARDGYPARASGSEPSAAPTPPNDPEKPESWPPPAHGDRTGETAVATPQPDPVKAEARRLINLLREAERALGIAKELVERRPVAEAAGDPGCQSCARLTRHDGTPRWEPPYDRLKGKTTVGGRLREPMVLCRWCYYQVADNDELVQSGKRKDGLLPTRTELQLHHEGKHLRRPA